MRSCAIIHPLHLELETALVILGRFSDGFAILPQRVALNHTG